MSSIPNITASCRGFVDQMNRSAQGWKDELRNKYYNYALYPMVSIAAEYQSSAYDYMRMLDDYERQIAALAGFSPMGTGIDERELYRQQIDPQILEQIKSKQRH